MPLEVTYPSRALEVFKKRMNNPRGIGIFSVSMEVEGSPNFEPTPDTGDEANLVFTLVSVRTWGIT
eukprot:CAMPEP_0194235800 /NCGR_PEP_ID=MMETSP0158-20130606/3195_1 /TAXON_ID=33649 /ORGANISM="Thalassionema nitzschioides, Strain L26-B" /LENGTH=65 /DNA_ID=CAMNT_0038969357 /DNA_START=199 /DNA_END=396 /DNA_ORIENTATION=-